LTNNDHTPLQPPVVATIALTIQGGDEPIPASPRVSPEASPETSPAASPGASPEASPGASPAAPPPSPSPTAPAGG
jgi:hypothetical protein